MRTITYYLNTNQVVESDTVYPNAFSADDNTTQLVFDFTGTACESWAKWLDLTMSDYTKDVQSLGNGAIVTFNLGAEHTKKGLLQVNPYAKNGTDKHGFPIYKLTIERQLNNSTVDASAQQSMIDYFDARLTVKAVNTTTLGAGESATASVTVEPDGATYTFGVPQGIQGEQGIQGVKGNNWRGAYSAGTAYAVDDVVSYNGSSYICILASTGNLPTNTTYWALFAQKGDNTTASAVTNTPAGNISATTVQGAINELDTEKAPTVHTHDDRYYTETEANTLLGNKADKLYATNLVTNGDFTDMTGWTPASATLSATSNTLIVTGDGTATQPWAYKSQTFVSGRKYFIKVKMKVNKSNCVQIRVRASTTTIATISAPAIDTYYNVSGVFTATSENTINLIATYNTNADALNSILSNQYLIALDLTAIFGAGKEPSAIQMDNMLSTFTNSWFNGTSELISIANLAQLKADKTQEAWITPTLLNSWANYANGHEPCGYMKDQFGFVRLKGAISGGTTGQNIFTLPVGYRPGNTYEFVVRTSGGSLGLQIRSDGTMYLFGTITTYVHLSQVAFKAV